MNKFLTLILVAVSATSAAAQSADPAFMNDYEKAFLREINILRNSPSTFLEHVNPGLMGTLRTKVAQGIKDPSYYITMANGKTDTIRYDNNSVELKQLENIQEVLEHESPLPPIVVNPDFFVLSGGRQVFEDTLGYRSIQSTNEYSTNRGTVPVNVGAELVNNLYNRYTSAPHLDTYLLSAILSRDPKVQVVVHFVKQPDEKYAFSISTGFGKLVPKLATKVQLAGLDNDIGQFALPQSDGYIIVGTKAVIRMSDANTVIWRYDFPAAAACDAYSYSLLKDNTLVIAGLSKPGKKNQPWLCKLGLDGKKVWEKTVPSSDGLFLSVAEEATGKGFWALSSEGTGKKKVQSVRLFDTNGNELSKSELSIFDQLPKATTFEQDVTMIHDADKGRIYLFGILSNNAIEGCYHMVNDGKVERMPDVQESRFENEIGDRVYANFIVAKNPTGGFYAAYSVDSDERHQDYKLVVMDEDLIVINELECGGDRGDGVSSMIVDKVGNVTMAGFSYSGVSGQKSEPAFEEGHCDVWVIKIDNRLKKLWDKTIPGPGCIMQARLFSKGNKTGVIFREETHNMAAVIDEY